MSRRMTIEQANAVYDILVRECGAADGVSQWGPRARFVYEFSREKPTTEWRFQGRLGFGGKLYCDHYEMRVGCYPEDVTPERNQMIERANSALQQLRAAWAELA